jgi:membrane complex biogenesis BtpA family protein
MHWLIEMFGQSKPIIGMCHFKPLPGDPNYDDSAGLEFVIDHARKDVIALQNGGVDAVMFSNEGSLPYLTEVESITVSCMARIIGELLSDLAIPFGVNVLWDSKASIDLAVATGAKFVREIFTGVYASDFGLWDTNAGEVARYRRRLGGQGIRLLFNIVPESAVYLGDRQIEEVARSTVFNTRPDALCVSGLTAGQETSSALLDRVKQAVPGTPLFANTGVRISNVRDQLSIADGAIVGTTFKHDENIWNEVDEGRVSEFMEKVREVRKSLETC